MMMMMMMKTLFQEGKHIRVKYTYKLMALTKLNKINIMIIGQKRRRRNNEGINHKIISLRFPMCVDKVIINLNTRDIINRAEEKYWKRHCSHYKR